MKQIILIALLFTGCNQNFKHHVIYYHGDHSEFNYYPDTLYSNGDGCLTVITGKEKNILCGSYVIEY